MPRGFTLSKEEAERLIVEELRLRLPQVPYTGKDRGRIAYQELLRDRPDLFQFRTSVADKWHLVSAWMGKHGLTRT